jgi:hypothetical protein
LRTEANQLFDNPKILPDSRKGARKSMFWTNPGAAVLSYLIKNYVGGVIVRVSM